MSAVPLPLTVVKMGCVEDGTDSYELCGADGVSIASCNQDKAGKAHAKFIVQRCNTYDALREALGNMLPLVLEALAARACSDNDEDLESLRDYREQYEAACAVLARAIGHGR